MKNKNYYFESTKVSSIILEEQELIFKKASRFDLRLLQSRFLDSIAICHFNSTASFCFCYAFLVPTPIPYPLCLLSVSNLTEIRASVTLLSISLFSVVIPCVFLSRYRFCEHTAPIFRNKRRYYGVKSERPTSDIFTTVITSNLRQLNFSGETILCY